tara:strand:- start:8538 stop:9587 length:1050 start_codon:yes stop_codon:yes gene_type:complete
MSKTKPIYLSASRLKTVKMCSWLYWCKYHQRLPDKSNDGASRGTVCHLIFECLGKPSRRHYYDVILEQNDPFAVDAVKKLILKKAVSLGVDDEENMQMIKEMILAGLRYDFFGKKLVTPSKSFSEYEFDMHIKEGEKDYSIKGFIDKLFIYDKKKIALIRDFKTSKQLFQGEDKKKNLQDYIYSIAVKYLFPEVSSRNSEFVFLRFDLESKNKPKGIMKMRKISDKRLEEFEIELTQAQHYLSKFNYHSAISSYAADKPNPTDGSFGGPIACGRARYRGQPKKDGSPMWHCAYKFPFDYYGLFDKDEKLIKTEFPENYALLLKNKKDSFSIKKLHYAGCPRWNYLDTPA